MNAKTLSTRLLVCLPLLLVACEEEDAVSLRIRVQPDLSGTVIASGLAVPASPGPVESRIEGATWTERAQVVAASGSFAALSDLRLDGMVFETEVDGELRRIKVTIPRGPDVAWARAFLPKTLDNEERRTRIARTIDPQGNLGRIGGAVKIAFELPGDVVSHGVNLKARRLEEGVDGREASLVLPSNVLFDEGKPLTWLVTWEAPPPR